MSKKYRIYYHHTDSGGVVYYARYLEFLEEARSDFLEERGILIKEMLGRGIFFVVARQEIDYKLPAFYGDTLEIDTQLSRVSAARVDFTCGIRNQHGETVSCAKTVLVCVNNAFKPCPLPEDIRKKLE